MDRLTNQLRDTSDQLQTIGLGILQLIVVLVAAFLVARVVRRRIRRRLTASLSPALGVLLENSAVAGIYLVAITIALTLWGLTWSGLVTALSIGTVAVAFGFQDLLRSVVGGMLAVLERPFSIGDRIKVRDVEGRVEQIALRTTIIRTDNGDRVSIPNSLILTDPINNRSPNRTIRVLSLSGLDGTPAELRQRALDALAGLPGLDGPPTISVRTKQTRRKVRRALGALPGIETKHDDAGEARGIGMRLTWTGDGSSATRNAVKSRLAGAFPNAQISTVTW